MLRQLSVLLFLITCGYIIKTTKVETKYSSSQQMWCFQVVLQLIQIQIGFIIFRYTTKRNLTNSDDYFLKVAILNIFQTLQVFQLSMLYYQGKSLYESEGCQRFKNGYICRDGAQVENKLIHETHMALLMGIQALIILAICAIISMVSVAILTGIYHYYQSDIQSPEILQPTYLGDVVRSDIEIVTQFNFDSLKFSDHELDCSICLEKFENSNEVIQLACSKYHIFHARCLEQMMTSEAEKVCPLCRQPIQIQQEPILE